MSAFLSVAIQASASSTYSPPSWTAAQRCSNDAMAAVAIREFQRLDQEGFTRSVAYVVMPDHIHWLVELRAGTLENVMKRFKSRTRPAGKPIAGTDRALVASLLSRSRDPL
ncbi:hypothetical protein [Stenotrophomonas sp. SPM]|uniref:hypothetical protein n=1 Tax=Stenotrophomonas sp. SPM TaxID=2170735 RepID=UPI0031B6E1BA